MTDDLTQTAFRIADEASISLVQCNAQRINAWTYTLTGEEMADEAMDEAMESLLIRCDDSDSAMYGTLSTSFVRDTVRIARGALEESK